jgi:hypothetical protein
MGQSGIDNPGTLATFGTQVTGRRQKKNHTHTPQHSKLNRWST